MARGADKVFSGRLRAYFGCDVGAYSPVTRTEAKDGQITLTGSEKKIALQYFGADELAPYRGNDDVLEAAGLDARREFRVYPSGDRVYPKVKYAKSTGGELRLYFNDGEFKVSVGSFWGIYVKDRSIWLCDFSPWLLEDISSGSTPEPSNSVALEPDDDAYQDLANDGPPEKTMNVSLKWKRNPQIASRAFDLAGHICEIRPDLETFTSKKTGQPFLEAHHLVPMKAQSVFQGKTLDTVENVCVLSPFSHRKLHHAPFEEIKADLVRLIEPRQKLLAHLEISEDFVFTAYGGRST